MPAGNLAICFGFVLPSVPFKKKIFPFSKITGLTAQLKKKKTDLTFTSFSPTLMGSSGGNDMLEQKLQACVIETILLNTYQIFDDD